MQHALKQTRYPSKNTGRARARLVSTGKNKKSVVKSQGVFNLVMLVAIALFSIALLRVVQYALYNQYALENEQLKQRIASTRQISEELSSRKLTLESPQRIQTFATAKLKMIKPESIRYIVYREPQAISKLAYVQR